MLIRFKEYNDNGENIVKAIEVEDYDKYANLIKTVKRLEIDDEIYLVDEITLIPAKTEEYLHCVDVEIHNIDEE